MKAGEEEEGEGNGKWWKLERWGGKVEQIEGRCPKDEVHDEQGSKRSKRDGRGASWRNKVIVVRWGADNLTLPSSADKRA
eukprot:747782-Hanusia_phi.AAC.1